MIPNSEVLTDRQQEIYNIIVALRKTNGNLPTIREIGIAAGIRSPNGVVCHLRALRRKGLLQPASSCKSRSACIPLKDRDNLAVVTSLAQRMLSILRRMPSPGVDVAEVVREAESVLVETN